MPEFNDPIWTVIGVVATFIFGFIGVVACIITIYQLIQNRKRLSYEIETITPILKIDSGLKERVEIRLDGNPVNEVYLILFRLFNSGRTPIEETHYAEELSISFSNGKIVSAETTETTPESIGDIIENNTSTEIVFQKALLNSKDEVKLKILINDFSGKEADISVRGRISGVNNIIKYQESPFLQRLLQPNTNATIVTFLLASLIPFAGTFIAAIGAGLFSSALKELINPKNSDK